MGILGAIGGLFDTEPMSFRSIRAPGNALGNNEKNSQGTANMPGPGRPFQKGRSGNSNGRPRGALTLPKIRKLLKPHASKFVDALLELLRDPDWRAKGKALEIGMAYLWGKPPDPSPLEEEDMAPNKYDHRADEELEATQFNGNGSEAA